MWEHRADPDAISSSGSRSEKKGTVLKTHQPRGGVLNRYFISFFKNFKISDNFTSNSQIYSIVFREINVNDCLFF